MSFDTVKNGIAGLLKGLGYAESQEAWDFENVSSNEYGNTFILNCLSGEMDDAISRTLIDRFYDVQEWQIQIAFAKSAQNEVINRDNLHRKKDAILPVLDNPSNWRGYCQMLEYKSWNIQETENYFLLTIKLKVVDKYTY